ncbi:uncharacterized protein A4U43_C09F700 [Asparagus officinalis]|uniref:Glycosyl hydrolase family 32 N-terminal domain-containing protein n=1 Tax=Asparagus officinalis TaxID=4686 RepID=A0A5P1E929_ASPOF|nr:uncharacterized protein A4U43_C09F700 [Asparagus officinalis]
MYYKGLYHFCSRATPRRAVGPPTSRGPLRFNGPHHWTALELALTPSRPSTSAGAGAGSATILPVTNPSSSTRPRHRQQRGPERTRTRRSVRPVPAQCAKPDYNPIIVPFEGIDVTLFRDPSTRAGQGRLWPVDRGRS